METLCDIVKITAPYGEASNLATSEQIIGHLANIDDNPNTTEFSSLNVFHLRTSTRNFLVSGKYITDSKSPQETLPDTHPAIASIDELVSAGDAIELTAENMEVNGYTGAYSLILPVTTLDTNQVTQFLFGKNARRFGEYLAKHGVDQVRILAGSQPTEYGSQDATPNSYRLIVIGEYQTTPPRTGFDFNNSKPEGTTLYASIVAGIVSNPQQFGVINKVAEL